MRIVKLFKVETLYIAYTQKLELLYINVVRPINVSRLLPSRILVSNIKNFKLIEKMPEYALFKLKAVKGTNRFEIPTRYVCQLMAYTDPSNSQRYTGYELFLEENNKRISVSSLVEQLKNKKLK